MSYHIKAINLNEQEEVKESFKSYKVSDSNVLDKLSKINIFVGENNSGKSQFLRKLQSIEKYYFAPNNFDITKRNKLITTFYKNILTFSPNIDQNFLIGLFKFGDYIYSNEDIFYNSDESVNKIELNTLRRQDIFLETYNNEVKENFTITKYEFKKIYIPILRGLRNPIDKESKELIKNLNESEKAKFDNLYHQRTITDYQLKTEIFTGLSLYDDIKKLLLGTLHMKKEK